MGEVNSCIKEEHIYLKQYVKATNKKRSLAFVTSSGQPLNTKTIKAMAKEIFEKNYEKGLITDYKEKINEFLEEFASPKFIGFLTNFALLAASEANETQPSPQIHKLPPKIEVEMRGDSYIRKPRKGSDDEYRSLKMGNFKERVYKFIEIELLKKENFFLELARVFCARFSQKYENDIVRWSAILKDVKTHADIVTSYALTMIEIKNVYKTALKEIKDFKSVFNQLLQEFLKEMFYTTHKNDSLLFQQVRIDKLIVRIIFEKTSIYTLFFTLIRLNFIDEELKLNSVHTKHPEITPMTFNVDEVYCLSDMEVPYLTVIEEINNLDTIMIPHDKFTTICKMRKDVAQCLDKYYETTERNKDYKKKIILSAENILPLFSYCIAASRNLKIRAHQVFIEEFVDENLLKFGEEGYSFSTFIAATDYLVSLASYEKSKKQKLSE